MKLDSLDIFATRCGVIVELFWKGLLGHTDHKDCDCAYCDTNVIYDSRGADGTVCLRCGCKMTIDILAEQSGDFICIECEERMKEACGQECAFCCAPMINGECSSFDK